MLEQQGFRITRNVADIPTAIKFCKVAGNSSRRAMYQLGRAYAANRQMPEAIAAWRKAADKGSSSAMVELGVLYGIGKGVAKDDAQARKLFERAAEAGTPRGVTNLAALGGDATSSDPERAREMFSYAASYFGNADAQYDLARLYLKNAGTSRDDFRYAARWLGLAAQKGQHQAQALLGQMLFNGDQLPRQAARGLMWLTLARDSAAPDETWIKDSYNKAISKASDDDRAMALQMLEHWVQGRRD